MGTLTADIPMRPEYCPHKLPTSCRLTSTPFCCACADRRPHSSSYRVYIDGVGFVFRGTRWQSYCWFCKVFWDNRVTDASPPIEISRTRIPEVPDQTEWLERWYEWHKGYRLVTKEDGSEERIHLRGESLREVAPGRLPRGLNELRGERFGFETQRSHPRDQHPARPDDTSAADGPSLEDTLDELIEAAAVEEEGPAPNANRPERSNAAQWNPEHDPVAHAAASGAPERVMSDMERLTERIAEAHTYLARARQRRQTLAEELEDAETEVRAKHERLRRLERDKRRMENFARVFGTREDIERQGDAYESPIGSMFSRAYNRYRQAEEARQEAAALGESLDQMDVPANVEIGNSLRDLGEPDLPLREAGPPRPRPDYPDSQLLRDQLAIIRQLSGDSARIRSELSAIRQLSSGASTASATAAPSSASASAIVPASTSSPSSSASLEVIRSRHERMTEVLESHMASPQLDASQQDATLRLISHLRSTTAEAEALVSAINSFDRIRETTLAPPPDQPLGLDVSTDRPEPKSEDSMMARLSCQVCYTQIADTAVLPCGHLAMCRWCADMAVPGRPNDWTQPAHGVRAKCPVCREKVKKRVRIYAITQE